MCMPPRTGFAAAHHHLSLKTKHACTLAQHGSHTCLCSACTQDVYRMHPSHLKLLSTLSQLPLQLLTLSQQQRTLTLPGLTSIISTLHAKCVRSVLRSTRFLYLTINFFKTIQLNTKIPCYQLSANLSQAALNMAGTESHSCQPFLGSFLAASCTYPQLLLQA